ncbi:MAG: HAD family hydrolase [Phycisphaerae bacterium]
MRFIIECDGPVLDVQPAHWAAYSTVCRELGLARIEPVDFWRAVRRGDPDGQLVRGAKPLKIREFRRRYDQCLETDEVIAHMQPHDGSGDALRKLAALAQCNLISPAANRQARQQRLDQHDLSIHFTRMKSLSTDRGYRIDQLRTLSEGDHQSLCVVSSASMILACEEADLFTVGVTTGPCSPARLTRTGARCTFASLADLADDLRARSPALSAAGFVAA